MNTAWGMRDAVDAGIGVGIFPCALATRPGWRRVQTLRDVAAPLWILTHKDLRTTARVRVLRDYLAQGIAEKRARHRGPLNVGSNALARLSFRASFDANAG